MGQTVADFQDDVDPGAAGPPATAGPRCLQFTLRRTHKTSNRFLEMLNQSWPGHEPGFLASMSRAAGPPGQGVGAGLTRLAFRSLAWADAVPVRFVMPTAGRDVAHPRAWVRLGHGTWPGSVGQEMTRLPAGAPVTRPEPGQRRAPATPATTYAATRPGQARPEAGTGRPAGRLPGDQFGQVSQRGAQMICGKRGEREWESLAEGVGDRRPVIGEGGFGS